MVPVIRSLNRATSAPDRSYREGCDCASITFFKPGPQGYDDDLRILTSPWGFPPEKIRVPVHLWHGDVESVIPLPHARYLAKVIPGATLKICPGEAHMLLWNHLPEILTIAVTAPQQ
jgi:pimeloyl-ACP methyl ester carboxylesterase